MGEAPTTAPPPDIPAPSNAWNAPWSLAAWQEPGLALRPVARWWWPGGSVETDGLRTQLDLIAAAGFGAVEVQPLLLGLGEADLAADPQLRSVSSARFHERIADAALAAAQLGLGFDLTLGSGWPGGLPTAKSNAERQLWMSHLDVVGPAGFDAPPPAPPDGHRGGLVEWVLDVVGPFDPDMRPVAVMAGRLGPERDGVPTLLEIRDLSEAVQAGRLQWEVPEGRWRIFAFHENSTSHFVMGGAYPGRREDARVVDHLSARGADALLQGYAAPVFAALPAGSVREVFVDSFELMGELPFTEELPAAFAAQAGYPITPHLPLLFRKGGESKYAEMMDVFGRSGGPLYTLPEPGRAERVREDYERVRAGLFEERFVRRIARWVHARGAKLRLQAHGGPADYLDLYALADVPESEALFAGGSFDFLKLAASAAHVTGRRWASSESFIALRLLDTRLDDEEMRMLAGRAYSAGINRIVFHGLPQPYARADGEAWYPFPGGFGRMLAGPLPISSRFDTAMLEQLPEFNRFLSRLTLALSQGEPSADVAWLRADGIFPDTASLQLGRIEPHAGESGPTRVLRARGLVHDRVSRRMLSSARLEDGRVRIGAAGYRAILLDPLEVAEPELVETLAQCAESGIPVLALGVLPQRAPGLRDAAARDARVRAARKRLAVHAHAVHEPAQLEAMLAARVRADLVEPLPQAQLGVSLLGRKTAAGDVLLVFNESWSTVRERLRFTRPGGPLLRWDPSTGAHEELRGHVSVGDVLELDLAPAEALILTLARPPATGIPGESDRPDDGD